MIDAVALAAKGSGFGVGLGATIYAAKWFFEWIGGRMDKRADRLDAGTAFLLTQLQAQVGDMRTRLERVEKELDECRKRHAESEAEVIRLQARLDALGVTG